MLFCLLALYGPVASYNDLFRAPVDYPVGANPKDIVAADFDRDGDPDLAITNFGRATNEYDSITIFYNDGNGVFQFDTNLATGDGPRAICTGKFAEIDAAAGDNLNGDFSINSYPDLAVLNGLSNTVSVFLNEAGMGYDALPMFYAGQFPSAICAAPIRTYSFDDLIIGNSLSMTITVLFNNGGGTFYNSDNIILSNDVRHIKAADLDNDGDLDLIVATADLELLFNTGHGTFGSPVIYDPGPGYFGDACAADLDNDGDLDIAGTNADHEIVRWFNLGDGTFDTPSIFPASNWPSRIFPSDLDRDGDYDLVMTDTDEDVVLVSVNDGSGNFSTEGKYSPGGGGPNGIVVIDIDDDHDDDVISTSSATDNISVFFNKTHDARCVMEPSGVDVMDAYGALPMTGVIYLGDFDNGYPAGDIDPFSLTINGVAPSTVEIVNDYPGLTGDVVRMVFDMDAFVRNYGAVWGWKSHYFRVSGQFADETPFTAGSEIYINGFVPGDANANREVNIGDPVFIMDYLYREGEAPLLNAIADANCDGGVDIGDVVYLVNYIFKGGAPPNCP